MKKNKINQQKDSRGFNDCGCLDAQNTCHAVSLSGGKDSTCLLILMVEKGLPIDVVITAATGMEFPELDEHLAKVDDYLYRERGLHITTLRHPKGFEWLMFDEPKQRPSCIQNRLKKGIPLYGNGWSGIKVRWCTGQLKTHLITREVNRLKAGKKVLHYIGIATDEVKRCKDKQYPLVEWGITEDQALQICYQHGFDFGGLYEIYHRPSCYCCPFQRISDLRSLRKHHPRLWKKLMEMDIRAREQGNSLGQDRWDNSGQGGMLKNWSSGLKGKKVKG